MLKHWYRHCLALASFLAAVPATSLAQSPPNPAEANKGTAIGETINPATTALLPRLFTAESVAEGLFPNQPSPGETSKSSRQVRRIMATQAEASQKAPQEQTRAPRGAVTEIMTTNEPAPTAPIASTSMAPSRPVLATQEWNCFTLQSAIAKQKTATIESFDSLQVGKISNAKVQCARAGLNDLQQQIIGAQPDNAQHQNSVALGTQPNKNTPSPLTPTKPSNLSQISTPDTRLVVGVEESAASAQPANTSLLFDALVTAPLAKRRYHGWFDFQLNGLAATASTLTIKQLIPLSSGDLASSDLSATKNSVQGTSLSGIISGLKLALGVDYSVNPGRTFDDDSHFVLEPRFVGGLGFTTPVQSNTTTQIWAYDKSNPTLTSLYPQRVNSVTNTPYANIAFVPADRSRFFFQWFAGLRLVTHHLNDDRKEIAFPGLIDITAGQDQAITGGTLKGAVLKMHGFYPLQVETPKAQSIYLFGSISVHKKSVTPADLSSTALFLKAADSTITMSDPSVDVRAIVPTDRDEWRFGVGVDLLTLFRKTSTSSGGSNPPGGDRN